MALGEYLIQVHGHKKIIQSLFKSIEDKTLPPVHLFSGPSGVGKKKTAFLTAQYLLCQKKSKPCGQCSDCQKIESNTHPSLFFIEPETLRIKIDSFSQIRSFLSLQSFSPCRVVIIDQSDKMNVHLQNALLKTLEEPAVHVYFFLITNRVHQLLGTVRSRTQHTRFHLLTLDDLRKILPDAKDWLLKKCRGQLDRVDQWQERESLYQEIFHFWENLLDGKPMSKNLSLQLKERKTSLLVARSWQEILRDVRIYQEGSKNWIHPRQSSLYSRLSHLPSSIIDDFYQKSLQLEEDISSYLDCVLCFENFHQTAFYKINQQKQSHVF